MTAALFATITATQVITSGKDHQPVIQVVVLVFDELDPFACAAAFPHDSKDKHGTGAPDTSRREKAALKIIAVK